MDRKPWRNSAPATQEFEEESEEEDSASDGGEEAGEEEEEEEEEEEDEEEKEKRQNFFRPAVSAVQEVSSSSSSETEEEEEDGDDEEETEVKSVAGGASSMQQNSLANKPQSSAVGNLNSETESETEEEEEEDGNEEESPKSVAAMIMAAEQKPLMVNYGSSGKQDSKKKKEKEKEKGDGKRERGLEAEKADESAVKKRKENGGGVAAANHSKAEKGMLKSSILPEEEETAKHSRKKAGGVNNHDHPMPAKSASSVRKDRRKSADAFAEVDSENKSSGDATPKLGRKNTASATENELLSPHKQKKMPQIWSHSDQMALAVGALKHAKSGKGVPYKKGDEFWAQLNRSMECDWTTEQLCEKLRRMKQRYKTIVDRSATDGSNPNPKNSQEKELFKIWKQMWGGEMGETELNQESEEEEEEGKEEKEPHIVLKQEANNDNAAEKAVKPKGKTKNRMKKPKNTEEFNHSMDETEAVGDDSHHMEEIYANSEKKEEDGKKKKKHLESTLVITPPKKAKNSSTQPAGNRILEEIRACCSKMLKDVETKCVSTLENAFKSVSKPGGNGFSLVSPILGMPLGGGNMMEIRLPIIDSESSALKRRWTEQQLQELKVFSDRLELMQEQCRIQQEQLEQQLGAK